MTRPETTVPARDGLHLLVRQWLPEGQPWLHVLLVHGLGEHSGRYAAVAAQMTAAGIAVHAYDHRGNGGSDGARGDVMAWSQLHDDLEDRLAEVRRQAAGLPVALYAHSMGGLIAAGYCLSGRPRPSMVVLSAPGFDSTLAGWKKALAPWLARVWPGLRLPNDVDPATLSRDPAVGEAVARDPQCGTTSTARFGAAGVGEQRRVRPLLPQGLGVRRWCCTAPTMVWYLPGRALRSREPRASSAGSFLACATNCTRSPRGRLWSAAPLTGCTTPPPRCARVKASCVLASSL